MNPDPQSKEARDSAKRDASRDAEFGDLIRGMKKALKRKAYDSDSDSTVGHLTNRGNKLRKRARYVHEGQLAPPSGPEVYKRTIEYGGHHRDIISQNPIPVDQDGYEVERNLRLEAEDDERAQYVQIAIASAAEFDPYCNIRIEDLLAPLKDASELPDHPTLSKAFTSKTLTELTKNAGEMVQKERASLWRIKHLLTRLTGDSTWIPCETVETANDLALFLDDRDSLGSMLGKPIGGGEADQLSTETLGSEDIEPSVGILPAIGNGSAGSSEGHRQQIMDKSTALEGVSMVSTADEATGKGTSTGGVVDKLMDTHQSKVVNGHKPVGNGNGVVGEQMPGNGATEVDEAARTAPREHLDDALQGTEVDSVNVEAIAEDQEDVPVPRRMRTRAQAQAASDDATSRTRSMSPESVGDLYIHPFFLAPPSSHADRNVGLPESEADEARRLLQHYVQKQEEVCRGAQKVYEGLLKADRHRKLVMKWAKAEKHRGEMLDGEDWYDKEEWGLVEDLKKGQDEEEEDAATTAKKTRTRRQ